MKTTHDADLQVGDQFVYVVNHGAIGYEVLFREDFTDGTANVVARQHVEDSDRDLVVFALRPSHTRASGRSALDEWTLVGTGGIIPQVGKWRSLAHPGTVPVEVIHDTTAFALQMEVNGSLPSPVWLGPHHNVSFVKTMLRKCGLDYTHEYWEKNWTTFYTECTNVQALMDKLRSIEGVHYVFTTVATVAKLEYFKWRDAK